MTGSTNDDARRLAIGGAPDGTLVTAAMQTAGRGRGGRAWVAEEGDALLMSLVLRSWPRLLPLAAPLAVCDVVGESAFVKWPNDVVTIDKSGAGAGGNPFRKLSGILIEGRPTEGWVVLGIGVNVAVRCFEMPRELRRSVATMGLEREAIERILQELLRALEARLSEAEDCEQATLSAWRERDGLRGEAVSWRGGKGVAEGIDDDGALLVRAGDGSLEALSSGEVSLAWG